MTHQNPLGKRPLHHINKIPYITMRIALWKTVPQYLGGRCAIILPVAIHASCQESNLKKTEFNPYVFLNLSKPFKAKFTVFHCAVTLHLLECVDRCSLSLYALILVFVHVSSGRDYQNGD